MKIAVINFSGNVGKTTIARHLLLPRIDGAELIAIESVNAGEGQRSSLRGRQFAELQEFLQTVENVVVDIGASNVEELLQLMKKYRGSHEDFDYFVVPTVPAIKQQQDTTATLAELAQLGVPSERIRLVFNMVPDEQTIGHAFEPLLAFLERHRIAHASANCRLGANEIYGRVRGLPAETRLDELARDETNYKSLIAKAGSPLEKLELAGRLATRRLAIGVIQELDECFAALAIRPIAAVRE